MLPIREKVKVAEFLLKNKFLDPQKIKLAEEEGKKSKEDIEMILIRRKYLSESKYKKALSDTLNIPIVRLDPLEIDPKITNNLPESFARNLKMICFNIKGNEVDLAISKLLTSIEYEDIMKHYLPKKINFYIASDRDINRTINEFYGFSESIERALNDISGMGKFNITDISQISKILEKEQPVIKLIDLIIHKAIDQRASDIHIEPKRHGINIRLRIDGILHTVRKLPKELVFPIIARVKIMAGLDISERRRPQDGRIRVEHEDRAVELRVAIIPTLFGEKIVLRLLDPRDLSKSITDLGMEKNELLRYKKIVHHTNGIVLITGPTGSGKTTTLYATLNYIKDPALNIMTVEDPVELINEDFNQISLNHLIGLDFAAVLREILRQDPDVIMVGEIRDKETADNAIRAALTGHLVFSTLHTNDAISAIDRLRDMGIPDYLISSTLLGVIAQRLVRRVCSYCKIYYEPNERELKLLDIEGNPTDYIFTNGKGCKECNNTGYLGREAIYEIVPFDEKILKMIENEESTAKIKEYVTEKEINDLRKAGVIKAVKGITTISEILRVTAL
jgi:general secretion pathway protein E